MTPKETGFSIVDRKGFHITFENGCTVSVQFGGGNYCSNRDCPIGEDTVVPDSPDAEIAGWDADGDWLPKLDWNDDVSGNRSPSDVLNYMNWVAALSVSKSA